VNRRQFLGAVGLGGLVASAGCFDEVWRRGDPGEPLPGGPDAGVQLPLSRFGLHRGAARDGIPAITVPAFAADWSSVDATLDDDHRVIGVDAGSETRAYPLSVLVWHGAVNDVFERSSTTDRSAPDTRVDGPVLVTYCPLSGSGVVVDRRVAGEVRTFAVSGLLWQSTQVLYDVESESLWSPLFGTAISGPLRGTALGRHPATVTTWGEWRREHPETTVLLPPPVSDTVKGWQTRDYDRDPYRGYAWSARVGVGHNPVVDERLHPKVSVVGIVADGVARAYPSVAVDVAGVVNDTVGTRPVVVAATRAGSLVAYDRRVDGVVLDFERDGDVLVGGGSRWNLVTGRALDGTHEGTRLAPAADYSQLFWFAWAEFNPETEIYGEQFGPQFSNLPG
jgi:hypothetical protein